MEYDHIKGTYLSIYSLRINVQCELLIVRTSDYRWQVKMNLQESGERFHGVRENILATFDQLQPARDYVDRFCQSFLSLKFESEKTREMSYTQYKTQNKRLEEIVKLGGMVK